MHFDSYFTRVLVVTSKLADRLVDGIADSHMLRDLGIQDRHIMLTSLTLRYFNKLITN